MQPVNLDLYAIIIFLGLVQAVFLAFFFLSNRKSNNGSNLFRGILLIALMGCGLEIFLMYTGYIQQCLFLVDFSEPLAFLIGPAFYLGVLCMTRSKLEKIQYVHLAFPLLYAILLIPFLAASEDFKYNAWVDSFDIGLPLRDTLYKNPRLFWLTEIHTELTLVSIGLYGILGFWEVFSAFKRKQENFWSTNNQTLVDLRWSLLQILSALAFLIGVKIFYKNDTGDHLFAAFISFTIYSTSFRAIQQSGFFKQASLHEKKYKSSSLTLEQQSEILERLTNLMQSEKPFLQSSFSLPDLAGRLRVSVHQLSQVINEQTGKSFFELVAEHRVTEAKILLREQPNIKVEEIAEQVGYNSKSSFNTTFKKLTGQTPSDWRSSL
jgi:AraC-like DNA-binding protein